MLKKAERLSKAEASWLLRKGEKFNNAQFSIKFRLNKKTFCRYSIVVSKKTLPLATDRNTLRRQLYETLRDRASLPAGEGYDYIILVKPPLLPLPTDERRAVLLQTLDKISFSSQQTWTQKP